MQLCKGGLKENWNKIAETIFYLAYMIELGMLLIDKSELINPFEGRLFQITFLLCVIKVMMTKYSYKEWGLMIAFGILGAISYFATGRNEVIRVVLFVAASKNIDVRRLMKYTFYITLIGVVALMALSAVGVLGWNYVEADFDGDGPQGIIRRYCFGLGHPNAFHCMLWCLILLALYLYMDKMKWYHFGMLAVVNGVAGYYTQSKTGIAIGFLTIILAIGFRYWKWLRENVFCYILGMSGTIVAIVFSIVVAKYSWDYPIFVKLDSHLTGRLLSSSYLGGTHKWSLFSTPSSQEFFDMGYVRLFYWYGIIPAVVYLTAVILFMWHCCKERDYKTFLVIIMFAAYTMVEAHAISDYIARNYSILLLFGVWNQVFHVVSRKNCYLWQMGKRKLQSESDG